MKPVCSMKFQRLSPGISGMSAGIVTILLVKVFSTSTWSGSLDLQVDRSKFRFRANFSHPDVLIRSQWPWPKQNESLVFAKGLHVFLGIKRPETRPRRNDVTLATYATPEHLVSTASWLKSWDGGISMVLVLCFPARNDEIRRVESIVASQAWMFERTEFHVLFANKSVHMNLPKTHIWNLAIESVDTDYALLLKPQTRIKDGLFRSISSRLESHVVQNRLVHGKGLLYVEGMSIDSFVVSKRSGVLPRFTLGAGEPLSRWLHAMLRAGFYFCTDTNCVTVAVPRAESRNLLFADVGASVNFSVPIEEGLSVFSNMIEPALRPSREDISIVTQTSMHRIERVIELASFWKGPMSVAVFLLPSEAEELVKVVRKNADVLAQTSFHLMFHTSLYKMEYPVNILRNIATFAAGTDLIFANDIDFMPSASTRQQLLNYSKNHLWKSRLFEESGLIVVPAFEQVSYGQERVPQWRKELLPLIKARKVQKFQARWDITQGATNYRKWIEMPVGSEPYRAQYVFKNYEPYVLAAKQRTRRHLPRYWDFRGRHWDKASWFMELNALNFKFFVATGEAFLVHLYHPPNGWNQSRRTNAEMKNFVEYLHTEYAHRVQ